jgi:hypothetical protein
MQEKRGGAADSTLKPDCLHVLSFWFRVLYRPASILLYISYKFTRISNFL